MGKDIGRKRVERECGNVRGEEEKERDGGRTMMGWRENETNCE
jgi:hypothetical protein